MKEPFYLRPRTGAHFSFFVSVFFTLLWGWTSWADSSLGFASYVSEIAHTEPVAVAVFFCGWTSIAVWVPSESEDKKNK